MQEFQDLPATDENDPLNAVVVGLAPSKFDYETLCDAFRLLNDGAQLIAVHKSRYFKKSDGKLTLGPGPFVAGLEYATGVQAKVVGKPEKAFYEAALDSLNDDNGTSFSPEETLMIGDDVLIDVIGAQKAGFRGCLVQTGKYQMGDESKVEDDIRPELVYPSILDIVKHILDQ